MTLGVVQWPAQGCTTEIFVARRPSGPPSFIEFKTDAGGTMTQRLTYTVREAAEILGISATSAYECVQ